MSVDGKGIGKCQVWIKQASASEQSMTCRKAIQPTSKPDRVVDSGQIQTVPVEGLGGVRRRDCMNLIEALVWNVGTCWLNARGREIAVLSDFASTKIGQRGGATRSSDEIAVMVVERRGCVIQPSAIANH